MSFLFYLFMLFLWERWYMGGSLSPVRYFRRADVRRRARHALDLNPAAYDARVDLARDALERGRPAAAETLLAPIVSRDDTAEIVRMHGEALLGVGRHEEAVTAFRKALDVDRREVESRLGLAKSLSALKRWEEASVAIETFRVTRPGDARGSWAESAIRRGGGDGPAALESLRELIREQRLKPGYAKRRDRKWSFKARAALLFGRPPTRAW